MIRRLLLSILLILTALPVAAIELVLPVFALNLEGRSDDLWSSEVYLTNPGDLAVLTDPAQRDAIAEAVVVAVKRLYLLDHDTSPTGTYSFKELLREEQA